MQGTKILKPYQGLKPPVVFLRGFCDSPFLVTKTLKPYQGLKPPDLTSVIRVFVPRRKNPKTLSGIETAKAKLLDRILPVVGKTLKPYQGLKPKQE